MTIHDGFESLTQAITEDMVTAEEKQSQGLSWYKITKFNSAGFVG